MATRAQHQWAHFSLQPGRIVCDATGAFHFNPLGIAKIRLEHKDDVPALIDGAFQRAHPRIRSGTRSRCRLEPTRIL